MSDDDRGIEITITHNGEDFRFLHNELTAIDVRDCRRETGFTVSRLLGLVGDSDVDIDSLAAMIWLARRQRGERSLRFETVAAAIHPNSAVTLDIYIPGVTPETNGEVANPE